MASLSALILSTVYVAYFYALLTLPQYDTPIDSLKGLFDLIKNDRKIVVKSLLDPNGVRYFNTSEDHLNDYLPLGQHYLRTNQKNFSQYSQLVPILESNPKHVIIESRIILATERFLRARLPLHIASDNIDPKRYGIIAQKGSPLIGPLNKM